MSGSSERFRTSYELAFRTYLEDESEDNLRAAYELGRAAVGGKLGVLDVAAVHHEALQSAVSARADDEEIQQLVRAAGDFFLESVSAFEMVQRGFREAREAALFERRQAAMLRQLSSFLGDASLAVNASDSLEEMLRLVAEQARELTGARCCVALARIEGAPPIQASSYSDGDGEWSAFLAAVDLAQIDPLVARGRGATRLTWSDVTTDRAARSALREPRGVDGWLAAPLTTLTGSRVGAVHLLGKAAGDFSDVDEAVVVHLAQMASAALERVDLYRANSTRGGRGGRRR